jgi:hypothetical protein
LNETPKTDLSISMDRANLYSMAFALPAVLLLALAYILRWGGSAFWQGFNILFGNFIVFIVVFFLGVVVHELIHGLSWMLFGRKPFGVIKFGFQLKTFTPYAHCTVPLPVNPYRLGTAMPGILLGLLPALIGILTGNGVLLGFGLLFTAAAGGDMLILWLIRHVDGDKLVEDHPTNAGCYILDTQ